MTAAHSTTTELLRQALKAARIQGLRMALEIAKKHEACGKEHDCAEEIAIAILLEIRNA